MKQAILSRLKSRRGDSLSEVLVAMLIAAMGLVILASMITSSVSIIRKSKATSEAYVKQENALVSHTESEAMSGTVTFSVDGSAFRTNDSRTSASIDVNYFQNNKANGKTVVSYEVVNADEGG